MESSELWIEDCFFSICRAANGGAILAKCYSFSVERTRGAACAAWQIGSFCNAVASDGIEVYELQVVKCHEVPKGTIWLVGGGRAECLNATGNEATICGSALGAESKTGFWLRFGTMAMNKKGNCLTLDGGGRHDMSCVSVVGNICENATLVAVSSEVVMALCIFQGNSAGSFIGTGGESSARLVRCVVDFQVVSEGSVVVVTEECVLVTKSTSFADCCTRTPMPTLSVTERPGEGSDDKKRMIGGIAGGCGAAVVIGVLVAGTCIWRTRRQRILQFLLPTPLDAERPDSDPLDLYMARA
jgi:hypothetical protein